MSENNKNDLQTATAINAPTSTTPTSIASTSSNSSSNSFQFSSMNFVGALSGVKNIMTGLQQPQQQQQVQQQQMQQQIQQNKELNPQALKQMKAISNTIDKLRFVFLFNQFPLSLLICC